MTPVSSSGAIVCCNSDSWASLPANPGSAAAQKGEFCQKGSQNVNIGGSQHKIVAIILAWNSLSDIVVTASSLNSFRKQLNTVNLEKFLIVW